MRERLRQHVDAHRLVEVVAEHEVSERWRQHADANRLVKVSTELDASKMRGRSLAMNQPPLVGCICRCITHYARALRTKRLTLFIPSCSARGNANTHHNESSSDERQGTDDNEESRRDARFEQIVQRLRVAVQVDLRHVIVV